MDAESNQFSFAENFAGFHYISNAQLEDTGQLIQIRIERIPVKQIAIFMSCVVLAVPLTLFLCAADTKTILGLSFAAVCGGGMCVGVLWLANQSFADAKLPSIDKEKEELILPGGSRIGKDQIVCFRQFECRTKLSDFRLVLTTVVTSSQNQQYAVCAEIGRFKSTRIGYLIANHFGAEVIQIPGVIKEREQLRKLGLE